MNSLNLSSIKKLWHYMSQIIVKCVSGGSLVESFEPYIQHMQIIHLKRFMMAYLQLSLLVFSLSFS